MAWIRKGCAQIWGTAFSCLFMPNDSLCGHPLAMALGMMVICRFLSKSICARYVPMVLACVCPTTICRTTLVGGKYIYR